ncbi:ankyrin repeat domain-containing protein [Pseudonocardia kujensis]|uniref:ankyrin repeat domain-containing protein n=1 Tax=Pseudonocardia kujensis TaxID=1128675 RepID=UPI001E3C6A45|nr:ankyrin repeat domain-containing protein [Pseudonocardia kujensis]MCE0766522.1 ankyrin repeat domain-containing protein [Pseudonocardia kujensis]
MTEAEEQAVAAIRAGDVAGLSRLLAAEPALATARPDGARTLLHVVADRPGNRPAGPEMARMLVAAGADVDARFVGAHRETALHWAASNDGVPLVDALLDAGAAIDADGAVIADGTPLSDAVAFGQHAAARRLVERGATPRPAEAAALGMVDLLVAEYEEHPPRPDDVDVAFWYACHGGSLDAAEYLLARGADVDVLPLWEGLTPLDAAERAGAREVVVWLRQHGAHRAAELG